MRSFHIPQRFVQMWIQCITCLPSHQRHTRTTKSPLRFSPNPKTLPTSRSVVVQAAKSDRCSHLRELLAKPGILLGPCCHDALSAKLIEQAGFPYTFMSGFTTSASRIGAPDTGLITYSEMIDTGRAVHEATKSIPVIEGLLEHRVREVVCILGDGDTGYGNPMNVKRTVRGYANAGFAGILIEDQVSPKSCGHVKGKQVVDRQEAISRVAAACDARDEGEDITIMARSDARQAESLQEALWRAQAFADQGADILFIDALASVEEMRAFCKVAPSVPKLANMLEGGGKTPILLPADLEEIGFKLAAYPLSLLGVSIGAMESALESLKSGRVPQMPSFSHIQKVVGFPEYFAEEDKYKNVREASYTEPSSDRDAGTDEGKEAERPSDSYKSSTDPVEPDDVIDPSQEDRYNGSESADGDHEAKDESELGKQLRLVIREVGKDSPLFETTFLTGFIDEYANLIPNGADFNIQELVKSAIGGGWDPAKPIFSITSDGNQVELFLE